MKLSRRTVWSQVPAQSRETNNREEQGRGGSTLTPRTHTIGRHPLVPYFYLAFYTKNA